MSYDQTHVQQPSSCIKRGLVGGFRNYKGYEEVRVPGIRHKLPDEAMVQVASMPDWAQLAFHGYKYGTLAPLPVSI